VLLTLLGIFVRGATSGDVIEARNLSFESNTSLNCLFVLKMLEKTWISSMNRSTLLR
jgi:hypothetical protein